MKINALVMAGGQGTRFWPESTSKKPKQYLTLFGDKSLLQQSLDRFDELVDKDSRYIVTVNSQLDLVSSYKDLIAENGLIFEPLGRNTAPCILLSLAHLIASGANQDDIVAIVPADHVILNEKGFRTTIKKAAELSLAQGDIVTIGITPSFPHTGYGYIKQEREIGDNCYKVDEFKEKPDLETAKEYLATGEYFWNAGMFVATIETLLSEFKAHAPEIFKYYQQLLDNIGNVAAIEEIYKKIPADSIDYAVMEKSSKVTVVGARFDWNDLGSWDALESVVDRCDKNFCASSAGHYYNNAKGNIVYCPDRFVSLVNVHDMVVVVNDQAVLVIPKKDAQEVKNIVNAVGKINPDLC